MSVNVRIPTILRTYTGGQAEVTAEGGTLGEVIADLEKNHTGIAARVLDDQGKLRRFVNVYVNDDDVRFEQGLETATPDGAGVSIIPAVMRRLTATHPITYGEIVTLGNANHREFIELPPPREKRRGQFSMVERGRVGEPAALRMPGAYEFAPEVRQEVAKVPRLFEPFMAFMGPDLP